MASAPASDALRPWPARLPFYYGWVNLLVAGVAMTATLPGRTHGLGLVTEPLLQDLGLGRVEFANVNLAATVLGAGFALAAGWFIDKFGVRLVSVGVGLALAASVYAITASRTAAALLVALTLVRGFGQSALSVVSLAIIGKWFVRRLGVAMAVFSVLLTVGFIGTVLGVGGAVQSVCGPVTGDPPVYANPAGWRAVWNAVGLSVALGMVPLAWLLVRDTPESCGLAPDRPADSPAAGPAADFSLLEAVRTPAFWVFAASTSFFNLIWSGVTLFNESILAERGFPADASVQVLAVLTAGGMLTNLVAGPFAKRRTIGWLLGGGLLVLAAALCSFPWISSSAHLWLYAAGMGVAGGVVMVAYFAVWGHLFGRSHLGRIQGFVQVISTLASAVGPLVLAASKERLHSYSWGMGLLGVVVGLLAVSCLLVPPPRRAENRSALAAATN